nr:hypothetical protein Iba_chr13eCG1060 [Ipomoea batatas]
MISIEPAPMLEDKEKWFVFLFLIHCTWICQYDFLHLKFSRMLPLQYGRNMHRIQLLGLFCSMTLLQCALQRIPVFAQLQQSCLSTNSLRSVKVELV